MTALQEVSLQKLAELLRSQAASVLAQNFFVMLTVKNCS